MGKVKPIYNLGDVVDKLSILSMKIYFGDEASISEHRYLEKCLDGYKLNGKIVTNALRLMFMNRLIWELENEMRNGGEDRLGLEEVGRRAIKIRDFNKKRIEYKNIINGVSRGFLERKVLHRSA
jgi:hypothetical protein